MFVPSPLLVLGEGLTLATLLVIQVLIGLRKIRFKGALHLRVHRWNAYLMLGVASVHIVTALAFLGYIAL